MKITQKENQPRRKIWSGVNSSQGPCETQALALLTLQIGLWGTGLCHSLGREVYLLKPRRALKQQHLHLRSERVCLEQTGPNHSVRPALVHTALICCRILGSLGIQHAHCPPQLEALRAPHWQATRSRKLHTSKKEKPQGRVPAWSVQGLFVP